MAELKKQCPFCGCIMLEFSSEEEAIEAFNNRVTEAEIRAMAIDEFAEQMKSLCKGIAIAERFVDETAEKLKAGE